MPDGQDDKLTKIRQNQAAIQESLKTGASTPKQESSGQAMSPSGFIENVGDVAFDIAKGLFVNLPAAAAGVVGRYLRDPEKAVAQDFTPSFVTGERSLLSKFKDAIIEPYEKYGLKAPYYRPVTTALDALTLWSFGTGTAARTAKLAGLARGEEIAKTLQELPSLIVRKGVDAAGKAIGIDLPTRRAFLPIVREEESRKIVKAAADRDYFDKSVGILNDAEDAQLQRFIHMGGSLAEVHANPKIADALRAWRGYAERWQEEWKARGVLDDEMIDGALLKKYAFEKHGKITKEFLEEARDAIKNSEIRPIYGPAIVERKGAFNLDDLFKMPEPVREGKVGFLEQFRGGKGAITSPKKWIPKAIEAFREAEKRFRLTDRVIQNPDWVKAVGRGEAGLKEIFREGVFKRYFENNVGHAQALKVSEIIKELQAAGKTPKEIAATIAESTELQKRILDAKNIAVSNPTIRNLLKWEFVSTTNGLARVYNSILSAFKTTATRLNPRWYTGNVIGDAFLGTLGGARWIDAITLMRKGGLPMEAAARMGQAGAILGMSWWSKLERSVDIAGAADQATRIGLITKFIRDHFVSAGQRFELSSNTLKDVLRSTENFSEVQVQMQRIEERIAARSVAVSKVDRVIGKLRNLEKQQVIKKLGAAGTEGFDMAEFRLNVTRQRIVNLGETRSAIVRDLTEGAIKRGELDRLVPGLTEQVKVLRAAVDYANSFVGEYLGLSGFERKIFTKIIPFYAWSKAMTMLAFRLPFIAPVKTFLWHNFGMAMFNMIGDQEMPEYTKGYVPMFARANGDLVWLKFSSFSPFGGMRMTKVGGFPIPSIAAAGEANPIFSLILRIHGGRTVWDHSSIPYGERMVNITNGDVYEYTGRGTLRKTIPQAPLISSILHMFPVVQFGEDVLMPYATSEHDWIGYPKPALKPDGSYRYPKEWLERIALLGGVPLSARKREDFIRTEKIRVYQVIRELRNSWTKADPEERKFIEQALKDYARGEYRRIEAN